MDSRLRVLRVIARLNVGGPALHVSLLTARLNQRRFNSLLAAGTPGPHEGDMLRLRAGLAEEVTGRVVTIPGLGRDVRPGADVRALRALWRLVGEFRPHILHTHTAKAGGLGRLVAFGQRVPVVVHTFHGTVFAGHFGPVAVPLIALAERTMGKMTDRVLAVSPAVAADLARYRIAPRRVRVVPLGLDLAAFSRVPALHGEIHPAVTLIARLVRVKDVPLFIEAAGLARRQLPELEVRVVGDGPLRRELEASAPRWVSFLGYQANLPAVLASTAVVVLTSHSEGSPVALIEALAAARPVVAVPVGGITDILEGRPGAIVTADRTPSTIAEAIVGAVTDRSLGVSAASGRARLLAEFGIDRLAGDIEQLYEELWAAHLQSS